MSLTLDLNKVCFGEEPIPLIRIKNKKSFGLKQAIHAFLVHSFFGKVNRVSFSRRRGHVILQKELSIHQISYLLDKCLDIILMLL